MIISHIVIDSLIKYYSKIRGIENNSVNVPAGGVGFLGLNGAGKSTLIRTLLGIIGSTRGNAQVLGYDIRREINQVRDRIRYIPEFNTSFIPDVTAMNIGAFYGQFIVGPFAGDENSPNSIANHIYQVTADFFW